MTPDGKWTAADIPDQSGKTILITGANSGIGFESAKALALKGAKTILACRSLEKAASAVKQIKDLHPSADTNVMLLDLADQHSVREFCQRFKSEYDRLDILINNAGVMIPPFTRTVDGFELQIGTNHFGHFTLTGMLLDILLKTPSSRIVTVSSSAHHMGSARLDDLNYEKKRYSAWRAYSQSKIANLWFTYELQRRLTKAGRKTLSVAAHPGVATTNLQRFMGIFKYFNPLISQKQNMGALPILYASVSSDVDPGKYYGPDGFREMRGYPVSVGSNALSRNESLASDFWILSEDLTGSIYLF